MTEQKKTKFSNKRRIEELVQAYTFITPAIIIVGIFFVIAIFFSIYLSFHNVNLFTGQYKFVGLDNYKRLFNDPRAMTALKNTSRFALFVVPIQTIIALITAFTLSREDIKGRKIFRMVYFLPTLTSSAALTFIFMFIFNVNGPINDVLIKLGIIGKGINFLKDPKYSLPVIMAMNIWSTVPYFMTIYLASLVDLPKSLYEAADIDGANSIKKFFYITVPYLRPITTFVLLSGIIGTFQMFDQAYIFSNGSGGPANSTLTIALMVYQYAFGQMNTMGYASAIAIVLAIVIFTVSRLAEYLNRER